MSGYFYAQPHFRQTSLTRIRLTIAALTSLIVCLAGAIAYFSLDREQAAGNLTPLSADFLQLPAADPEIQVLVANRRIEVGTRLSRTMFDFQEFPADRLPLGAVTAAAAGLVDGSYAKSIVHAGFPISQEEISDQIPLHLLPIPEGFRAITIEATSRELVEGFVVPNSRVDVIWKFSDSSGKGRVKTLIPFAKVLSVGGENANRDRSRINSGPTTVSLLVAAKDALKVELARTTGSLSLILLGSTAASSDLTDESPLSLPDLVGDDDAHPGHEQNIFEYSDPNTGGVVRLCLRGSRWS